MNVVSVFEQMGSVQMTLGNYDPRRKILGLRYRQVDR